jgi:hypothetical protein
VKIKVSNRTIEMNSQTNDRLDIPSNIVAAIMNKPFSIVMTKRGRIMAVNNIEKVVTDAFNSFPQVDITKKEQIKSQLTQTLSANTFRGNLEMETAIFPPRTVLQNEKWHIMTKLEGMVKVGIRNNYELTGTKGNNNTIHGVGVIFTDKNLSVGLIKGLPVKYNITGTSTADIKVDKVSGWISQANLSQVMKGNVEILNNPKVPGGAKIPMSFNIESVITN